MCLPSTAFYDQKDIGVFAGFKLKKGEQLRIRIGTSFSSVAEARKNLQAEINTWNFAAVLADAQQNWQQALSQITVQGDQRKR